MEKKIEHKNLVLSIQWYVKDEWYGNNYRLVLNGLSEDGFKTKSDAKKYSSYIKKYLKHKENIKNGIIDICEYSNLETYRYCSMGPSWSCTNIHIKSTEFLEFIENQKKKKLIYEN